MKGDRHPKSDAEAAPRRAEKADTATVREWSFVMYPQYEPTQEQSDPSPVKQAAGLGRPGYGRSPGGR